ncbi:deoxyribodipyrimidine photo-lyase [Pseudarthrobacter sp. O4]|uniref:deoxyribodipyrimidine photo-lyase n=1 Tax=Pseudarthrobacter sp. O4 TaxID=3418417 RepID=UPI003CF3626A
MSEGSTSSTPVWLRDDLHLDDNPARSEAASLEGPLTVVYVLDEASPAARPSAEHGINAVSLQANLLFEPGTVTPCAGGPYRLFRTLQALHPVLEGVPGHH